MILNYGNLIALTQLLNVNHLVSIEIKFNECQLVNLRLIKMLKTIFEFMFISILIFNHLIIFF